jgi:hypothetical protein
LLSYGFVPAGMDKPDATAIIQEMKDQHYLKESHFSPAAAI